MNAAIQYVKANAVLLALVGDRPVPAERNQGDGAHAELHLLGGSDKREKNSGDPGRRLGR